MPLGLQIFGLSVATVVVAFAATTVIPSNLTIIISVATKGAIATEYAVIVIRGVITALVGVVAAGIAAARCLSRAATFASERERGIMVGSAAIIRGFVSSFTHYSQGCCVLRNSTIAFVRLMHLEL